MGPHPYAATLLHVHFTCIYIVYINCCPADTSVYEKMFCSVRVWLTALDVAVYCYNCIELNARLQVY